MFKKGDIVIYDPPSSLVSKDSSYKIGRKYRVLYTEVINGTYRIGTQCLITGHKNGWTSDRFKFLSRGKSHLPAWW